MLDLGDGSKEAREAEGRVERKRAMTTRKKNHRSRCRRDWRKYGKKGDKILPKITRRGNIGLSIYVQLFKCSCLIINFLKSVYIVDK